MLVPIIENEYATLWYHSEAKIVHHQYHQPVSGAPFREVLDRAVELFQEYGASKWLSDDRANSALPPEDSQWAKNNWEPRAIAAGWKYWAIVMPIKVIGQMNMQRNIKEGQAGGVIVQVFSDPDDALQWLEAQ